MSTQADSFLARLEQGAIGLRLRTRERLIVQGADEGSVQLLDSDARVVWWFLCFPELHMDLSPPRIDSLDTSAARYARKMFEDAGAQDGSDGKLRTTDP